MFENLSLRSLFDPLREPALWAAALGAAYDAVKAAVEADFGWQQILWTGVYVFLGFVVRSLVTPLKPLP